MNHGKTTMNMQEFINDCIISAVKISQDTYDMKLDFSEESILIVDEVLEGYHERYLHPEEEDGRAIIPGWRRSMGLCLQKKPEI